MSLNVNKVIERIKEEYPNRTRLLDVAVDVLIYVDAVDDVDEAVHVVAEMIDALAVSEPSDV